MTCSFHMGSIEDYTVASLLASQLVVHIRLAGKH